MELELTAPLNGIRVVDLTTNISGPTATMILGGLGADVVKVERPDGDDARRMGPLVEGRGAYFLAINRDKRSIVADLKTERGVTLVRDLARRGDVLVENFRYGVAEQLGLGYESLAGENPALIYCGISAYGERGPEREQPGYDAVLQARTGPMSVTGEVGGPPVRAGVSLLDGASGIWAAVAILGALYERERTGRGMRVGTSLYEVGVQWMNYHLVAYQATHADPKPAGTKHPAFAPYGSYHTATDDLVLGISSDGLFAKLVAALGHPEWATDPAFVHNGDRLRNRDSLDALIEGALAPLPYEVWAERFREAGVPFARIQGVAQVLVDPQAIALDLLQSVRLSSDADREVLLPRLPLTLAGERLPIRRPPPGLGEHQADVLRELEGTASLEQASIRGEPHGDRGA